ncbi:Sugar or nucleoside kinase, ribokinase family [Andreprevotia lacus DSM 23236]|jgi:sugar/nucleoside kinase (ribokinase family)|uniref:Sugar or nucleoside kinase, ribokinase family n=1 Tax=Andreprevotia lacus DSM 23236 TaxID=1121001 RepID=A0A1W1X395_9NEIS|nr:carbohydrate kinase family protein [Andreprevotia lacus]SMC18429.1 Sugar or nucleoside kinase, ribokinase family [Andreprevotia lacus DSM 23236]
MRIDILTAGCMVADLLAYPVNQFPARGKLGNVERVGAHLGGSAANTGAHLVSLGYRVAIAAAVGDDLLGRVVVGLAEEAGLDTRWLSHKPGSHSAATMVMVAPDAERSFLQATGAQGLLSAADIPLVAARAAGARAFHLAGYFALPALEAGDGSPAVALLREATALGYLTALDGVWDAHARWRRVISPLLPWIDVYTPSRDEAEHIVGATDPHEQIDQLFALGVRKVVAVTDGAHGAWIGDAAGLRYHLPPAKVATVDTTGAGDAFAAGLLAALLDELPLAEAGRLASACGGLSTTVFGGGKGFARRNEAEALAATIIPVAAKAGQESV